MTQYELKKLAGKYGIACYTDGQMEDLTAFVRDVIAQSITSKLDERVKEAEGWDIDKWAVTSWASEMSKQAIMGRV